MPGAIGRVAELNAAYYAREWGSGVLFEAKVATELAGFDPRCDDLWTAALGGRIEGAITIDGAHAADEGAHLRWFIMSDALRGQRDGRSSADRDQA